MMLTITKLETEKELVIICNKTTQVDGLLLCTIFLFNLSLCALGFWFNHAYCGSSIIFNLICGLNAFIWLLPIRNMGKRTTVESKEKLIEIINKF